jgi:hypothetical protein
MPILAKDFKQIPRSPFRLGTRTFFEKTRCRSCRVLWADGSAKILLTSRRSWCVEWPIVTQGNSLQNAIHAISPKGEFALILAAREEGTERPELNW